MFTISYSIFLYETFTDHQLHTLALHHGYDRAQYADAGICRVYVYPDRER